jgi:hypothetical protein
MQENAVLTFRPVLTVRAERVAEVLQISIETANKMLSQPETKDVLAAALSDAFQSAILRAFQQMTRTTMVSVPTRVDCTVELPALPAMSMVLGI